MGTIGYGYGSEWHLLRCLGYHRKWFSDNTAKLIGSDNVDWIDFQYSTINEPLHQDAEFNGLGFISDPLVQKQWKSFWPAKAQHWDAVGVAQFVDHDELLFVEAKAHVEELGENESCKASSPDSLRMIRSALQLTQKALESDNVPVECWMEHYYQTCNRYAALHFLRNICQPSLPAHLVFVYFYGETRPGWNCPQSPEDWQTYLQKMDRMTGVRYPNPLSPYIHRLFVPVHPSIK